MKSTYVNFVELSFEEEERLLQRELSNRIGSGIQNLVAKPDPVIKELLPAQTLDRHQQSQKPNTAQKSHSTTLCAVIVRQSSGQQWTVMNSRGVRGVHEGRSSWRRWRSLEIIYITEEIWTLKTKGRVGGAFKHRRHAIESAPSDFWAKWIWMQLPKDKKNSQFIFNTITPLIRAFSASIISCIQICVCWLALSQRQTRLYSAAHYNQSHTMLLSLWMQWPIRGVQMSHR